MSDPFRAVLLGIVEGLTEFLPVSSTGHMILTMPLLGIDERAEPWPAFLFFIQIGAVLAALVYFFNRLWRQTFHPPSTRVTNHVVLKIVAGVLPAGIVGVPLNRWAEEHLEKPVPVAIALVVGAAAMLFIERRWRRTSGPTIEQVSLSQAVWIGLAQCVSIIPGTSRAMATIMGGMIVGLPAATAAEFSFYLAIPTLCGAGLLRLAKHQDALMGENAATLWLGFGVSGLVAWAVVAGFMRYVQTRPLAPFAVYRCVLGVAVLAWWLYS